MASDHERNTRAMRGAARCRTLTHKGKPCQAPAVVGKTRCWRHGGKASKQKTWGRQFGDYTAANLVKDREIRAIKRSLDREVRKLFRTGVAAEDIAGLTRISDRLLCLTQKRQDELAQDYEPTEEERLASHAERNTLAYLIVFQPHGRSSLELMRDRSLGSMLGLAVGEAVGITLHGQPRDQVPEVTDMVGGGLLGLHPGQWASDTATSVALLDSLVFRREFDATDFMERLCDWYEQGAYSCTGSCTGIDEATYEAIDNYRKTENPLAGDDHPDCLATVGAVRVAPVAIRFCHNRDELRRVARLQCRVTHAGLYAVDACEDFAMILADAIQGVGRENVLRARTAVGSVCAPAWTDCLRTASWKGKGREAIVSRDNVLTSLEAAMWCVEASDTFEEAVLLAVNLAGDAGTIAGLTGELAGALYGASSIPARWREQLAWAGYINDCIEALLDQCPGPRKRCT